MASWGDIISLILISSIFFGVIAGFVYVTEAAKKAAGETDEELRKKGITLTPTGIAIKTDMQAPSREDIIDAQSRAFLKGGEALARPGVLSAGRQASFTDEREHVQSAFEAQPGETTEQTRARFRRHRSKDP